MSRPIVRQSCRISHDRNEIDSCGVGNTVRFGTELLLPSGGKIYRSDQGCGCPAKLRPASTRLELYWQNEILMIMIYYQRRLSSQLSTIVHLCWTDESTGITSPINKATCYRACAGIVSLIHSSFPSGSTTGEMRDPGYHFHSSYLMNDLFYFRPLPEYIFSSSICELLGHILCQTLEVPRDSARCARWRKAQITILY
jgi:hypothetical protein